MRRIILLCCLFCCPVIFVAQNILRERVPIVRPSYHESAVTFLADVEKSLRKDGYTQAADMLKASLAESFGSGFVHVDVENNRAYVITNKHVVAHAKWVDIEFTATDGAAVTYERCPVAAVDEKYDIAAITLPPGAATHKGITFYRKPVVDGEEVLAVGYPGLNGEPSWQITKGIVANAVLSVPEILGEEVTIIQHTAEVDPGSSGGPLLIKNPLSDQYEVAGINTWKITRDGTVRFNLAIPASAISAFINRDLNMPTVTSDRLKSRVADFVRAGQTDYRKLLPFISYEYMSSLTADGFWELVNNASENRRKMVYDLFSRREAIDAIRVTLADALCRLLINKNTSVGEVSDFTSISDPVTVMLTYGFENASSVWISEQGHWRIIDFSPLKTNRYGREGVDNEFGYRRGIRAGVGIPFSKIEKLYATLAYSRTIYTYIISEWTFDIGKADIESKVNPTDKETQIKPESYLGINYGLGLQLPLKVSAMRFVPRLKGFVGWDIGSNIRRGGYGGAAGVQVAYKIRRMNYLIGGVDYRYRTFFNNENSGYTFPAFSSAEMYLGITF